MATQNIDSMKKYLPKTKETVKLKKLLNRSAGLASCFFQTAIAAFMRFLYCIFVLPNGQERVEYRKIRCYRLNSTPIHTSLAHLYWRKVGKFITSKRSN